MQEPRSPVMRRQRGMQCRILVPETASYPKIAQIAAYGADVVTIHGSRQDVADAALAQSAEIFYASHNWQPFFVEGTKTLAYELWEQCGFRAPDNVVVPLGYGSNILGCARGFDELARNGEIDRMPRLFGIQAANCAPYHAAYRAGGDELVPTDIRATVAEGIASSKPTRVREVLSAVRSTGGSVVAVTEDEIVSALGTLAAPGPVRGAYVGCGCGRPHAADRERRSAARRSYRAGADRVRTEGVRAYWRTAEAARARSMKAQRGCKLPLRERCYATPCFLNHSCMRLQPSSAASLR